MLVGSINDKEDRKLIFTSRVLRTKLGKINHPMLVKNLGRRNVLRKDTSVVQRTLEVKMSFLSSLSFMDPTSISPMIVKMQLMHC